MIIGTAGHIDHGKTSLVKALTGIDTDRLKEEKRRGITLELGFAHLKLSDGLVAGVVDVPGHEKFVKAMAAGAGGVDLVILVIAADEGVMPQTREHLDICRFLGVRAGVIAVTKSDLLPDLGEEWLDLLKADLHELTRGTFLETAPIIPCSSKTSEGLDLLIKELAQLAKQLPERSPEGPVFLPVDRAFTLKGFGTIVTGTLLSGQLSVEESVSLLPGLEGPWRVRGIQVHGMPAERVGAGQRTAVNLSGVEAESLWRGMVLCRHEELPTTRMLDVELTTLPVPGIELPKRKKLLLHLGTSQVDATVALLDVDKLQPGETGLAQLRLATEVVALPNQRFILRGFRALAGRGTTIAGGRILTNTSARRRKGAADLLKPLLDGTADVRATWLLKNAGYRGLTFKELFARAALPAKSLARTLELLGARGAVLLVDKERRLYLSPDVFRTIVQKAHSILDTFHQNEPLKEGMGKEELRQKLATQLDPRIYNRVVAELLQNGAENSGEFIWLTGRRRTLSLDDRGLRGRLLSELSNSSLSPPKLDELVARVGVSGPHAAEVLKVLVSEGKICRVTDDLYFTRDAIEQLKERLVAHLKAHREITTQTFKEMVGQSRKFVIPLSEFFDRERVTLRVGEKRVLRRG